jgi:hypothetical protein
MGNGYSAPFSHTKDAPPSPPPQRQPQPDGHAEPPPGVDYTEIILVDALCPYTVLECRVSKRANSDACPRPTPPGARAQRAPRQAEALPRGPAQGRAHGPGPPARPGRSHSLCALGESHSKYTLYFYGVFVWAHRARNRQKRWLPAPRAAACLVHYSLSQKVTSPRFTILNGCRPGQYVDRQTQKPVSLWQWSYTHAGSPPLAPPAAG